MAIDVLLAAQKAHWGWSAWAWLVLPLAIYGLTSLTLFAFGRTDGDNIVNFFFGQISDSLRRLTGFAGWAMAGVLSGLLFLLILVIGFYWDVAWHIDFGRDVQLFTPSHTMILVGLGGLVYTGLLTILFASLDKAEVGIRMGAVRIPWSALLVLALGAGGVAAFPLDNIWHEAYGIDVTLWSPTHLQLVSGGSLATIALFLMCAEAMPSSRPNLFGRSIFVLTGGTILVAVSTFQGEFDFGVPQFQALYLPLLIMAAAGFALVFGRIAIGPWGAVKVAVVYLALRIFLAVSVGGVLHHTVPRFPLYLGSALLIEAVAWKLGTTPRLRFALVSGAVVGTIGLVGELAFVALSGWAPGANLPADLAVKILLLAPLAALATAVLGAGLARAFSRHDDAMPLAAMAVAGVVLVAVLAFPLPRRVGDVSAVIRTEQVGDKAFVDVELTPTDAAESANAFAVTAWQGGGRVTSILEKVGPGRYRSEKPVPVTGSWKATVGLLRGDQVMAAPVYLPADAEIGAAEIPLMPERRVDFVRNTDLLLREAKDGPAWPAISAYGGLALLVAAWVALFAVTARRVPDASTYTDPYVAAPPLPPPPPPVPAAAWR